MNICICGRVYLGCGFLRVWVSVLVRTNFVVVYVFFWVCLCACVLLVGSGFSTVFHCILLVSVI